MRPEDEKGTRLMPVEIIVIICVIAILAILAYDWTGGSK